MTSQLQLCRLGLKRSSHTGSTMMTLALLLLLGLPLSAQQTAAASKASPPSTAAPHAAASADAQGPVLTSSEIAQGAILLHFAHAEGGLHLEGRGRTAFEIAGADHVWFPADAHLVNGVVVVSTSLVQQPTAVSYHRQSSAGAALSNGAGLPAEPFQTDK